MTVGRGMNGESPVGVVSCRANESAPPSKISKEARKAVAKKNMDTDHMVLAFWNLQCSHRELSMWNQTTPCSAIGYRTVPQAPRQSA